MKILIITSKLGIMDGWERYSQSLCDALKHNGVEVLVVCQHTNPAVPHAQFPILPSPLSFRLVYFFSWYYALKTVWILRKNDFDFVHGFVEPYSLIAFFIAFFKRKKYFLTICGTFAIKFFSYISYGFLQTFSYRHSSTIFSISHYTAKRLADFKKDLPITVIPCGISKEFLELSSPTLAMKPVIVSVGELKARKGFEYLLQAVALVREKIPETTCVIIGSQKDAEYFSFLLELRKKLGLEQAVTFFQKISDQELHNFYRTSKVFVLPSISEGVNFEGFGLVYLEANAFGLPAIGSLETGAEEAIIQGETGFLVEQKNPKMISDKICNILVDQKAWEKISKKARSWSEELSWEKIALRYMAVYNDKK